jgi:hypothetical protein
MFSDDVRVLFTREAAENGTKRKVHSNGCGKLVIL